MIKRYSLSLLLELKNRIKVGSIQSAKYLIRHFNHFTALVSTSIQGYFKKFMKKLELKDKFIFGAKIFLNPCIDFSFFCELSKDPS